MMWCYQAYMILQVKRYKIYVKCMSVATLQCGECWHTLYIISQEIMHTVFALLCFVVVIHWLIFPYPPRLLHWHCGNLTIAPVPAKQPWWIWINTSCELIMNDCITTTKQSTTKPCAYFLGYIASLDKYMILWIRRVSWCKEWWSKTFCYLFINFCFLLSWNVLLHITNN